MSPSRFQLEGASIAEVTARVQTEFGPHAKIIAAEAVTTGGIQGLFAQRHYEVTVEVPDDTAQDAHEFDLPARAGIAALLADADSTELSIRQEASEPQVSTESVSFEALIADLTTNTLAEPQRLIPRGPNPLTGAGDLVLVIGLGQDGLSVAREMTASMPGSNLRIAGDVTAAGIERVSDRRSVLAARASGVDSGHSVLVAFGLGTPKLDSAKSDAISRMHADQVWIVVDASRKAEDTARWVQAVQLAAHVDGIAVRGRELTSSPETVNQFDLPVGWEESGSVG